jgi:hypothetical protein
VDYAAESFAPASSSSSSAASSLADDLAAGLSHGKAQRLKALAEGRCVRVQGGGAQRLHCLGFGWVEVGPSAGLLGELSVMPGRPLRVPGHSSLQSLPQGSPKPPLAGSSVDGGGGFNTGSTGSSRTPGRGLRRWERPRHSAARATRRSQTPRYGDEKVANREIRVWHGATENGPCTMDKSKTPPNHLGSCRYLTLYRGVLDLSIIQ